MLKKRGFGIKIDLIFSNLKPPSNKNRVKTIYFIVLHGIYKSHIDYDPSIEYGLEFEYRLYYFFQFMGDINNITLIPRR